MIFAFYDLGISGEPGESMMMISGEDGEGLGPPGVKNTDNIWL